MHLIVRSLVLLLVFVWGPLGYAAVHACHDAQGYVTYQDQPCEDEMATVTPASSERAPAPTSSTAHGKHFLWKVSRGTAVAYLVGSIHVGTAAMYPLDAVITQSFERASRLVVEVNVAGVDQDAMAQRMLGAGMYTDGKSLREAIAPQTWRDLEQACTQLNVPLPLLQMQKPWLASLMLTTFAAKAYGYDEKLGIDLHFLQRAKQRGIAVVELESLDFQLGLFDHLSPTEQEAMLKQTLADVRKGAANFAAMVTSWRQGDSGQMETLVNDSFDKTPNSDHLYQLMFTDRNAGMAAKVDGLLQQGGVSFVVVGSGHLIGPQGVVGLLKKRGYSVEQL